MLVLGKNKAESFFFSCVLPEANLSSLELHQNYTGALSSLSRAQNVYSHIITTVTIKSFVCSTVCSFKLFV